MNMLLFHTCSDAFLSLSFSRPYIFPRPSPAHVSQTKQIALAWETALNPDAAALSLPYPSLLVPHTPGLALPPLTFDPTPSAPLPSRRPYSTAAPLPSAFQKQQPHPHPHPSTKVESCSSSSALFSFRGRPSRSLGTILITLVSSHFQKALGKKAE